MAKTLFRTWAQPASLHPFNPDIHASWHGIFRGGSLSFLPWTAAISVQNNPITMYCHCFIQAIGLSRAVVVVAS